MKQILLILAALLAAFIPRSLAQYPPQAGIAGSDAVPATSGAIKAWASGCSVRRGLQQIGDPTLGDAQSGDSSLATGAADGTIVSLGDSGVATLTFPGPLMNGPGADFAVFENGFLNPANSEEAFLELAFVEVSSDGVHFFRFPATSLTPATRQLSSVAGQDYMNARLLRNLAGKYISGYGTPFDLQELDGIPGLDVNRVTHIRVIDVIGAIDQHACYDSAGRKVNDPYPTAFPTGGFDLDAIAALHISLPSSVPATRRLDARVFPNPVTDRLQVHVSGKAGLQLCDATGRVLISRDVMQDETLLLGELSPGVYYLYLQAENGERWAGKVSRQ